MIAHAQFDGRTQMAGRWDATVVVDRTVEEVFAFLPDGENDRKFSPRVLQTAKTTDRDVDQEERCQSGRVDSHAGTA
jgi:hypothetical protein